jgi:radical SAM-linked protein
LSDQPTRPTSSEDTSQQQLEFGRGKKKVPSRNVTAPTKNCVRIRWSKPSRYRYMSHLDHLRMIERSLRRARLPVAYSHGFHPTMKLSFGPPLPLGFTSEAEYLDITLDGAMMPYMIDLLEKALPDGIDVHEARVVPVRKKSLSSAINRIVYTIPLQELPDTDELQYRVTEILNAEHLDVIRTSASGEKQVDIRPATFDVSITDTLLTTTLGVGDGGYARPEEILHLLYPNDNVKALSHFMHRLRAYRYDDERGEIDAMNI